jgi:transcriptional regulator with XRE-family HTH domain
MNDLRIGRQIKRIRRGKGITLEHVGEGTGFTKAYICLIESGKKLPPIATLSKIAHVLDVDIVAFFNQKATEDEITLVRREERKTVVRDGTIFGYRYESIAPLKRKKKMEPFVITHPVDIKGNNMVTHEGEELVYVLEGKINVYHGEKKYSLRRGDSLYFDSGVPHRSEGVGNKPAKALVVISQ